MKQRLGIGLAAAAILLVVFVRCGHRPSFLALGTSAYGPSISRASTLLLYLHGHGGSIGSVDWVVGDMRRAGLASDTTVVIANGPFASFPGRSWGVAPEEREESLARLRSLVGEWTRENPGLRVVAAGFSRGADMAVRLAAVEPAVTGLVAIAGCGYEDLPRLAERSDVRVTVVHAVNDTLCRIENGRRLADTLGAAGREVTFIEHREDHTVPPAGIEALVASTAQP